MPDLPNTNHIKKKKKEKFSTLKNGGEVGVAEGESLVQTWLVEEKKLKRHRMQWMRKIEKTGFSMISLLNEKLEGMHNIHSH